MCGDGLVATLVQSRMKSAGGDVERLRNLLSRERDDESDRDYGCADDLRGDGPSIDPVLDDGGAGGSDCGAAGGGDYPTGDH